MTDPLGPRSEARKRRSSGAVADFDPQRLLLARRLRRFQQSNLAERSGLTAAAISQYERSSARPTHAALAQLALALGVPPEFFRLSQPIKSVPVASAYFRSLRATPSVSREQALAFAEIALAVVEVLEQYVEFPSAVDIADPLNPESPNSRITLAARRTRSRLGLAGGPIPHVIRLLESIGILVLRLPDDLDARVDAFSTEAGARALVLLSPLKNDRARSRFDAAHELGHLVMHNGIEPGSKIVEQQANRFASEFLAPTDELLSDLPRKIDWDALLAAKRKWGISLKALVYRAHEIGLWGEHAYRRANQHLAAQGFPEQGPLGPPESPSMLGSAMDLLSATGVDCDQLSKVSRLPLDEVASVLDAGSETRLRLQVDPNSP